MHRNNNQNNNFQVLYWPLVIFGGSSLAFLTYLLIRQLFGGAVDALGPIFGMFGELFLWIYPVCMFGLFVEYLKALFAELDHLRSGDTAIRAIASWSGLFCLTWIGIPLSYYFIYYLARDLFGLDALIAGFITFAAEGVVYKLSLGYAQRKRMQFLARR